MKKLLIFLIGYVIATSIMAMMNPALPLRDYNSLLIKSLEREPEGFTYGHKLVGQEIYLDGTFVQNSLGADPISPDTIRLLENAPETLDRLRILPYYYDKEYIISLYKMVRPTNWRIGDPMTNNPVRGFIDSTGRRFEIDALGGFADYQVENIISGNTKELNLPILPTETLGVTHLNDNDEVLFGEIQGPDGKWYYSRYDTREREVARGARLDERAPRNWRVCTGLGLL